MDGVLSLISDSYLARFPSPLAAYNRLQAALMKRFVNSGGTLDQWMTDLAPAFRERYGWLCQQPVPVRVTSEHRIPRYHRR